MARAYVFDDNDPVPATVRTDGREPEQPAVWDDDDGFIMPGEPAREDFSIPRGDNFGKPFTLPDPGAPIALAVSTAGIGGVLKEVYGNFIAEKLNEQSPINPKNIYGRVTFSRGEIEASRDEPPGAAWKAAVNGSTKGGAITLEILREGIQREEREIFRMARPGGGADYVPRGTPIQVEQQQARNRLYMLGRQWESLPPTEEQLEAQTLALKDPPRSALERFTSALRRK